jgi:hypothetical protein
MRARQFTNTHTHTHTRFFLFDRVQLSSSLLVLQHESKLATGEDAAALAATLTIVSPVFWCAGVCCRVSVHRQVLAYMLM